MTLKQDMKVYYETFPESLKYCDWCNKSFRTVAGLRTHALRIHPIETAPNKRPKCSRCGDTGWLDGEGRDAGGGVAGYLRPNPSNET